MAAQDKSNGGVNGKTIYIDTQGKFRPERIAAIAKSRGFNIGHAMSNVLCVKTMSAQQQELIIENIFSRLDNDSGIRLLIVDTVISNYRAEYSKAEKQKKLYKFMCTLATIAQTYNIAVVVTNQVNFSGHSGAANPSGGSVIRNEIPDTEEIWQQYKENEAAAKEKVGLSAQRITDAIENPRENPEVVFKRTGKYPCGSKNKTQWLKHLKNQRRLEKQRRQEAQADWKLRMNAPIHLLEKTIREIDCRCEPEDMRQGVFCDTCRLF